MPWSYISGFAAAACILVLMGGGMMAAVHGGVFPWHCFKRLSCGLIGCCGRCGIFEVPFRSVHRVCALLLPALLFTHSMQASLGAWVLWTWMVLLFGFAVAECVKRCSRAKLLLLS
jgi:hypothetical protein